MLRFLTLTLLGLICIGMGCAEPERVQRYRIPKVRSDLGDLGMKKLPVQTASKPIGKKQPTEARMVVAIDARDDATWFYKVTGSVAAVDATQDQWTSILNSINYSSSGKPDWELPDGWKLGPPKPMRYATLLKSASNDEQVEISISSLGPNQDLLNNVNRWRNQLGLKPVAKGKLQLETLEAADGQMQIFDAQGKLNLTGAMARNQSGSRPSPRQPQRPKLKYDIPKGWNESNQSMMVPVRLRFGDDKSAPQITVTQLLAATNNWVPNAQRWAGQVALPDDEESLKELTSEIQVDGLTGQRIILIPEEDDSKIGMIGAMVVREDIAWFFKLIGDKKFVADNAEMFDQFMTTFKFDQG